MCSKTKKRANAFAFRSLLKLVSVRFYNIAAYAARLEAFLATSSVPCETLSRPLPTSPARRARFPNQEADACGLHPAAGACNSFRPSSRRDWRPLRSFADALQLRRDVTRLAVSMIEVSHGLVPTLPTTLTYPVRSSTALD